MTDWSDLEARFSNALNLTHRPVAVTFLSVEPANIQQFKGSEPSGWSDLYRIADSLDVILRANETLADYSRNRRQPLSLE